MLYIHPASWKPWTLQCRNLIKKPLTLHGTLNLRIFDIQNQGLLNQIPTSGPTTSRSLNPGKVWLIRPCRHRRTKDEMLIRGRPATNARPCRTSAWQKLRMARHFGIHGSISGISGSVGSGPLNCWHEAIQA